MDNKINTTAMDSYSKQIANIKVLSHQEHLDLFSLMDDGDASTSAWAREQIIYHSLRLVLKCASEMRVDQEMMADLVQEGNDGLMRAVEKFDPSLGYKFSTYAYRWIRYKIEMFVGMNASIAHVSHDARRLNSKVRRTEASLSGSCESGEVSAKQVAERLGESISDVGRAMALNKASVSLDATMSTEEGESGTLYSLLKDESEAYEGTETDMLLNQVLDSMRSLPLNQQEMIYRYYGLKGYEQESMSEISKVFGLTKQRVSQIVSLGVKKISSRIGSDGEYGRVCATLAA